MSQIKLPKRITSNNPYYSLAGVRENCTAWVQQVIYENTGKWYPQSNGTPCVGPPHKSNSGNETMWDTVNGYSKNYYRKDFKVGQIILFSGGTGHVELITKITTSYIYTTSMNYGEDNGAESFKHLKQPGAKHPVYKNLTMLGSRGTPLSYKLSK